MARLNSRERVKRRRIVALNNLEQQLKKFKPGSDSKDGIDAHSYIAGLIAKLKERTSSGAASVVST